MAIEENYGGAGCRNVVLYRKCKTSEQNRRKKQAANWGDEEISRARDLFGAHDEQ